MNIPTTPHFLLFSGACQKNRVRHGTSPESWRFVLESVHGSDTLEVADTEPGVGGERLELLAVVRGLEALNQPSQVTLITPSRYVKSGMQFGLDQWREDGWRWERFGHRVPVTNADLWKRVDRAMQYHTVECKYWRFDPVPPPHAPVGSRMMAGQGTLGVRRLPLRSLFCQLSLAAVQRTRRWIRRILEFGRDERRRTNYIRLVQSPV